MTGFGLELFPVIGSCSQNDQFHLITSENRNVNLNKHFMDCITANAIKMN